MKEAAGDGGAPGATRVLGDWVASLRIDAIPREVVDHAKLCLLDGVGCGLFGSQQPWGRISAAAAEELAPGGRATLWGNRARAGAAAAALANGTATHGFEIDDIHVRSFIHPGAVVIPAALAVGETREISGTALLTAVIAGYEVGLRVGIAAGVSHGHRGYHPTGTVGCVASAAAVGRLLELDADAATHALGIGATQASGLYVARKGAMAKRFHAGHAAQAGVLAGLLAERGFTGSPDVLEASSGGFMSTLSGAPELAALTTGLGQTWETPAVGFKAYAACASAHTIIDNLQVLMSQGVSKDNLEHLRIRMTTIGAENVGWPYKPTGVVAAQMNGFFAAAMKLVDGDVFIDQFREDRLADPRVTELMPRISIEADPQMDRPGTGKRHASRVEALLRDGRKLESYTEQRRGSSHRPLSREEIIGKFRRTSGAALDKSDAEKLLDCLLTIERQTTLAPLSALLAGHA